jgi:hypothetical protein
LSSTEQVLPEDGDRTQSPKRCVLKNKQDGVLDKDRTMDSVNKQNICPHYVIFSILIFNPEDGIIPFV